MALDLNDKTSNGNTLTNHNGVTEETSSLPFAASTSAAIIASASSQWLSAADSASLDVSPTATIELWVNFTTTPSSGNAFVLFAKDDQGTQRSLSTFLRNSGGTLRLEIIVFGSGGDDYYFWNWTPTTSTWYHLAWTIDVNQASATTFELFRDGVSQGNGTAIDSSNVTTITNSTATFTIGAKDGGGQYANMKVDEVRVWNTVRTGTQISNNKSVELTGSESGLAAYWPFEVLTSSASASVSASASASASRSASASLSPSASASSSVSASLSPSASTSLSPSASLSPSPSSSVSASGSSSVSLSPSASASLSASASASASPSPARYVPKYTSFGSRNID